MKKSDSYVYFAFYGDNFDPTIISSKLGIEPSDSWIKGDPSKYIQQQKYSCWRLTSTLNEHLDMNKLVDEVVNHLSGKEDLIIELKRELELETILEVVMWIDTSGERSTPMLGHDLKVIEFLHRTSTETDLDIYKDNLP